LTTANFFYNLIQGENPFDFTEATLDFLLALYASNARRLKGALPIYDNL
jgi:hypothetical protein